VRTPPIVIIEWDNAWSDKTTIHEDSHYYERGYPCSAAGFLQAEGEYVVVCRAWVPRRDAGELEHFSDCVSVPRELVTRVRQVRTWQNRELPPLTPPDKPVKRRRRRKARPPAEVPPGPASLDSDEVDPPESTIPPEEGE